MYCFHYVLEKIVARKNLRKATRASDVPCLEVALGMCKRLVLDEEDGDITAAKELLHNLKGKDGTFLTIISNL